jgi:hypothetical protein
LGRGRPGVAISVGPPAGVSSKRLNLRRRTSVITDGGVDKGRDIAKFPDYIYKKVRNLVMKFLLKCICVWLFSLVLLVTFFRTLRSREILPPTCDWADKIPFMHVSNGKEGATVTRIRGIQI